jgi:hypothetical protein
MVKELSKKDQVRLAAENDLEAFIQLVHPKRVLGGVHREVISWWNREDAKTHQLLLLPRDHQKSALIAYRVAWAITRDPTVRILYISSTSNLATKQLKFIKDILTSDIYRYYWPEMVNLEESQREKWTEREISVDHPKRKAENVRDPTIFTAGLTTGIVGMHCDISVFDDVVVFDNAYTEDGREKVLTQYSLLASIEGGEALQWVVGTRYDPRDLYQTMIDIAVEKFDGDGNVVDKIPMYETFEREVEDRGDGTGQFLWPRQQRSDGKWFGFNEEILSRKRAQYRNYTQFRAQYYNDPNDASLAPITRDHFQYYDKGHLRRHDGLWFFQDRRLNVFASIDFAFSLDKRADFTTLAVVGVDKLQNYYVLDLLRLKTDRISDYFQAILNMYQRWGFRRLRAEATAGQAIIIKDLKENYIRPYGLALSVEDYKPTRGEGTKEERVLAILQSKYENGQVWHEHSGNCQLLEEELLLQRPPHDDLKDALASAIDSAIAPIGMGTSVEKRKEQLNELAHPRFGGIGLR